MNLYLRVESRQIKETSRGTERFCQGELVCLPQKDSTRYVPINEDSSTSITLWDLTDEEFDLMKPDSIVQLQPIKVPGF